MRDFKTNQNVLRVCKPVNKPDSYRELSLTGSTCIDATIADSISNIESYSDYTSELETPYLSDSAHCPFYELSRDEMNASRSAVRAETCPNWVDGS